MVPIYSGHSISPAMVELSLVLCILQNGFLLHETPWSFKMELHVVAL